VDQGVRKAMAIEDFAARAAQGGKDGGTPFGLSLVARFPLLARNGPTGPV
jgi:hypothetical protein